MLPAVLRPLGMLWNVGFPFLMINGVPMPSLAVERDGFEWAAQIFIPLFVGVMTVVVSAVAVYATHSANQLAKDVEAQRAAAAAERAADAARDRLQQMAIHEAKLLRRWVAESDQPRYVRAGIPTTQAPPRTPLEQARIDAEVELQQSLVPGADDLFELTEYDLHNRREFIEYSREDPEDVAKAKAEMNIRRRVRTQDRIRAWALDPEGQAPNLAQENYLREDDPVGYLMFGELPDVP